MHAAVCRGLAVAAVSASLGVVLISPASSYADDPVASPTPTATATPVDPVTAILDQLGAGDSTGLAAGLAALTPAEVRTLLSHVAAGDLASVATLLSPAQVSDLGPAAVNGLQAVATGLGAAPTAAQVDTLVAQVNALLAATPPKDLAQLGGLLSQLAPLLATPGLDPAGLVTLWQTASAATAVPTAPSALNTILLVLVTGSTKAPVPTPVPVPTVVVPTPTAVPVVPPFTTFRVTVVRVRPSVDARHAYVVLRCPATVAGAIVDLTGTLGKRPAFKRRRVVLAGNTTKVVTVPIGRGSGPLTVTATTRGSSLKPSAKRAVL
ncbi:MAG: hypothetical protein QOF76_4110 [Solirubrobacteraceae bacterium]|jgi:hypothetical protein|nr:hypothetical protein [Solirubrobacteraceae bacterium]